MDFGSIIIGVCRFSYLGIGDWVAMHRGRKGRSDEEVMEDNRKILFQSERLERRFTTFEHLTLPSLAAQTDPDFILLTLSSDELPDAYKARLDALAVRYPFMRVIYRPVGISSKIFNDIYSDMGHNIRDVLQFRLDDDDAVSRLYISHIRRFAQGLAKTDDGRNFAITHPSVLYATNVKGTLLLRKRHLVHNSAGQAMRHQEKNVLQWAHHLVDRHLLTVSDPHQWVLQSSLSGINDSGAPGAHALSKGLLQEMNPEALERTFKKHFPFASADPEFWQKFMA